MRKPIGNKYWSEMNPPISPDNFESDIYPPSSMEKSVEMSASSDALQVVIYSLIKENQFLKAENNLLRNKMIMQQANPTEEAKQAFACSNIEYKKPKYRRSQGGVNLHPPHCINFIFLN